MSERKTIRFWEGITTLELCITAVLIAITCLVTMGIHIPIPLGYAHPGNSIIMVIAIIFGKRTGILAGSIGSAMSDLLLGYNEWIIPTLIIKAGIALIVVFIAREGDGKFKIISIKTAIGVTLAMVFMVVGYTASGIVLYGFGGGLGSAPGLIMEGLLNIILFFLLGSALDKAKVIKFLKQKGV